MNTKSETLFEKFLTANKLPFEKIAEAPTPRPDYLVTAGTLKIIFEVKELEEDENFAIKDPIYPHITSGSRTLGEHVRRAIQGSRKQIQYGASENLPSVLLIYNNIDPTFQLFGTESMDFTAAMYGAYTILFDKETGTPSDWFNGKDQMLPQQKNTSFSAIGHLCDKGGPIAVTLYENTFAKFRIAYDQLPACFEVHRIEISTEQTILP